MTGTRRDQGRRRFAPKVPRSIPLMVLIAIAVVGILAPLLVGDPETSTGSTLVAPSGAHLLGTDQYGFDILSRVVYSIRIDLGVAVASSIVAVVLGMPLGALAGFKRGWIEQLLLRLTEGFQSFPVLLLAIAVAAALGPSLINLILIISVVNAPVFFRLTRNAVLPLREADYVLMARVAGKGTGSILWHHILPNVRAVIVAQFSVNCAWAILTLAGLSFIGVGPPLPTAEWGSMIRLGSEFMITGQWWLSIFPGLAILITVLALNEFADGLRVGNEERR